MAEGARAGAYVQYVIVAGRGDIAMVFLATLLVRVEWLGGAWVRLAEALCPVVVRGTFTDIEGGAWGCDRRGSQGCSQASQMECN